MKGRVKPRGELSRRGDGRGKVVERRTRSVGYCEKAEGK